MADNYAGAPSCRLEETNLGVGLSPKNCTVGDVSYVSAKDGWEKKQSAILTEFTLELLISSKFIDISKLFFFEPNAP